MDDKLKKLKKIISEKFGVPEAEINQDSELAHDLNLSNLEINDLITQVCDEFDLILPSDNEVDKVKSISDLTTLIEAYSQEL